GETTAPADGRSRLTCVASPPRTVTWRVMVCVWPSRMTVALSVYWKVRSVGRTGVWNTRWPVVDTVGASSMVKVALAGRLTTSVALALEGVVMATAVPGAAGTAPTPTPWGGPTAAGAPPPMLPP